MHMYMYFAQNQQ